MKVVNRYDRDDKTITISDLALDEILVKSKDFSIARLRGDLPSLMIAT